MSEKDGAAKHWLYRLRDWGVDLPTLVAVLIGFATLIITTTSWKNGIENVLGDHERRLGQVESQVAKLYEELADMKTDVAVTRTIVSNIADAIRRLEGQLDSIVRASQPLPAK